MARSPRFIQFDFYNLQYEAPSTVPPAKSEFITTAATNFGWKQCPRVEPIRTGTASGQRRNNPHPHEVTVKSASLTLFNVSIAMIFDSHFIL